MVGSMGRVGAAGDNAAMESFFALLQKNVLNRQTWRTRNELRIAIVTWIERTYHRRRRQERLGRLTPIEYETIMNTNLAPAAYTRTVTSSCISPTRDTFLLWFAPQWSRRGSVASCFFPTATSAQNSTLVA